MNAIAHRSLVTLVAFSLSLGIAAPVAAQDGSRLERVQARIAQRDRGDDENERRGQQRGERRDDNDRRGNAPARNDRDDDRRDNRADNRRDSRPDNRPDHRRDNRPDNRRDNRPDNRQVNRPVVRPDHRPTQRPVVRPDHRDHRQDRREQVARERARQAYYDRLRAQQRYWNTTRYNAYFNTPMTHRYAIGGRYYPTNRYGVDIIRQAAQHGYAEGVRAGQADRYDGWRYDYRDSWAYRDGGFGYHGRYIDRQHYAHYFREGFRRGYEDGYYGQRRYGRYDDRAGQYLMIGAILSAILNID